MTDLCKECHKKLNSDEIQYCRNCRIVFWKLRISFRKWFKKGIPCSKHLAKYLNTFEICGSKM